MNKRKHIFIEEEENDQKEIDANPNRYPVLDNNTQEERNAPPYVRPERRQALIDYLRNKKTHKLSLAMDLRSRTINPAMAISPLKGMNFKCMATYDRTRKYAIYGPLILTWHLCILRLEWYHPIDAQSTIFICS